MITVEKIEDITEDDFVLIVKRGDRAPCKKVIQECANASARLTNPFYIIEYVGKVIETLQLSGLPAVLVYKNKQLMGKLIGHYHTQFQYENLIRTYL
jgi:hypothetical protein